jgi:hypothetical protein
MHMMTLILTYMIGASTGALIMALFASADERRDEERPHASPRHESEGYHKLYEIRNGRWSVIDRKAGSEDHAARG